MVAGKGILNLAVNRALEKGSIVERVVTCAAARLALTSTGADVPVTIKRTSPPGRTFFLSVQI